METDEEVRAVGGEWQPVSGLMRTAATTRDPRKIPRSEEDRPIHTTNQFEALTQVSDTMDMTSPVTTGSIAIPKPPPIHIVGKWPHGILNYEQLNTFLNEKGGKETFSLKVTTRGVTLYPNTPAAYRHFVKILQDSQCEFHTYQLPEDKIPLVVIRGLHPTTPIEEIKVELANKGYTALKITNAVDRYKRPIPLFFVQIDKKSYNDKIFDLRYLYYTRVTIEEQRKKKQIPQCARCQGFGHTKKYCRMPFRCIRCGGAHESSTYEKPPTTPATCANCGEPHPANYRGCTVLKNLQSQRARRTAPVRPIFTMNSDEFPPPPKMTRPTASHPPRTRQQQQTVVPVPTTHRTAPAASIQPPTAAPAWEIRQSTRVPPPHQRTSATPPSTPHSHLKRNAQPMRMGQEAHQDHRKCWKLEFRCENGECIRPAYLCDGNRDCRDGSDETDCAPENFRKCGDGTMKHKYYWCDGWPDCPDNHADELNCEECKEPEDFLCPNGRCIQKANVCDAQCDCASENGTACADEIDCDGFYTKVHGQSSCLVGSTLSCTLPGYNREGGRCVAARYICDGKNHCISVYDEYGCHKPTKNDTFRCLDNRTLPLSLKCDFKYDCLQGDDERGCPVLESCGGEMFRCQNGQCVEGTSRCNVSVECWDKTDEIGCHDVPCKDGMLKCSEGGQCIPANRWCNFYVDCPDASDEKNCQLSRCGADEFACDNGQCIPQSLHCYNSGLQFEGCADYSHLQNCRDWKCEEWQVKCHLGPCLHPSLRCNGRIDCQGTWDDEDNCSFSCSDMAEQCECKDVHINCTGLGIQTVPTDAEKEITWFYLGSNRLNETLSNETFRSLDRLQYLDLRNNSIKSLVPKMFSNLWRLTVLNLQNNRISELQQNVFFGLGSVNGLHLQGNDISTIHSMAFVGLSSLATLDLSHQKIRDIKKDAFAGLRSLMTLDLSYNEIDMLHDGIFRGMPRLIFLDISKNQIREIDANVFRTAAFLEKLQTDEFRFCCLARQVPKCWPQRDEFSSCEDLMSNLVLRVCVWVLGTVALLGNGMVIFWRAKFKHCNQVHSFLITNLALGDLLMGSYLLLIAIVDWYYRGIYSIHDSSWRSSTLCSIAGFISTFSSELSVFTLTVITLDRFLVIIFPFKVRRLEMRRTRQLMIFGWLIAIAISAIPLLQIDYFKNFYGRSGVCLALHITPDKPNGWEYSVFVFLFLNLVSFTVIAIGYLWMFLVARTTQHAVHKDRRTSESSMAWRMSLLVATDAACWVPIIILGVVSLAGFTVPPQVFAWVAVFILPLNAAVNPVLYTLSTAPFLTPARQGLFSFRRSCKLSLSQDRRTFVSLNHYNGGGSVELYPIARRSMRFRSSLETTVTDQGVVLSMQKVK